MKKGVKRAVVITAAALLFAAVICISAAMSSVSAEYDGDGGFFDRASFCAAKIISDPPGLTARKTLYRLFGVVAEPSVKAGGDGFLFPVKTEDFDYKADLEGELRYDADLYLGSLQKRKDAYSADGCDFAVIVIPNSQTVMKERANAKNKEVMTAAEALSAELAKRGFTGFYLLDPTGNGGVEGYDNTDNTINAWGAYTVYRQITELMPESVSRRSSPASVDASDVTVITTDGKELAKKAGIDALCKNRTVLYPDREMTAAYTVSAHGSVTVCALKDEYNGFIGRSEILLQIPSQEERGLFMPLFSSSYTNTTYTGALSYAPQEYGKPSVCLCVIREDSLSELLDGADIKTYEAHIKSSGMGDVTPSPHGVAVSLKRSGTAIVSGYCESGAVVSVVSASDSAEAPCVDGLFLCEIKAEPKETLRITAEIPGREASGAVNARTPAAPSCEEDVFAGRGSMLYYGQTLPGYTGSDLIKDEKLAAEKKRFENTISKIRAASGKQTKVIFLSAPDPLSVYPGAASAELDGKRADKRRMDQIKEILSDTEGYTFLDIRDIMRENTDIEKLYYQTDTHWTETGAYFGYRAIAEALSSFGENVSPLSLNSFTHTEKSVPGGDLSSFAGLDDLTENVRFMSPTVRLHAVGIAEKPDEIDRSVYAGALESAVNDPGLPTAVMIRDSYSANIFPWICEHFSYLYAQPMWKYEPDLKKIAELSPDYVIYVVCERNLVLF